MSYFEPEKLMIRLKILQQRAARVVYKPEKNERNVDLTLLNQFIEVEKEFLHQEYPFHFLLERSPEEDYLNSFSGKYVYEFLTLNSYLELSELFSQRLLKKKNGYSFLEDFEAEFRLLKFDFWSKLKYGNAEVYSPSFYHSALRIDKFISKIIEEILTQTRFHENLSNIIELVQRKGTIYQEILLKIERYQELLFNKFVLEEFDNIFSIKNSNQIPYKKAEGIRFFTQNDFKKEYISECCDRLGGLSFYFLDITDKPPQNTLIKFQGLRYLDSISTKVTQTITKYLCSILDSSIYENLFKCNSFVFPFFRTNDSFSLYCDLIFHSLIQMKPIKAYKIFQLKYEINESLKDKYDFNMVSNYEEIEKELMNFQRLKFKYPSDLKLSIYNSYVGSPDGMVYNGESLCFEFIEDKMPLNTLTIEQKALKCHEELNEFLFKCEKKKNLVQKDILGIEESLELPIKYEQFNPLKEEIFDSEDYFYEN